MQVCGASHKQLAAAAASLKQLLRRSYPQLMPTKGDKSPALVTVQDVSHACFDIETPCSLLGLSRLKQNHS